MRCRSSCCEDAADELGRSSEAGAARRKVRGRCAFSRDETLLAWAHEGGITFADVHTGAIAGRMVLSTSGRSYVLTDGVRFDWPGAKRKGPSSGEIVASEAGRPLDDAGLLARREPGLLARLTR